MNNSENNRKIQSAWYLSFLVFLICVCFRSLAPKGAQWISKWAYLDSSFSFLILAATNFVAVTKLQPFLWAVNDVTLAIDIQMTWRRSPPECSNEIAVQANEYFWLQVPWMSSECFFWFTKMPIASCLVGNITVVGNKFVVMIIKFRSCLCRN